MTRHPHRQGEKKRQTPCQRSVHGELAGTVAPAGHADKRAQKQRNAVYSPHAEGRCIDDQTGQRQSLQ